MLVLCVCATSAVMIAATGHYWQVGTGLWFALTPHQRHHLEGNHILWAAVEVTCLESRPLRVADRMLPTVMNDGLVQYCFC